MQRGRGERRDPMLGSRQASLSFLQREHLCLVLCTFSGWPPLGFTDTTQSGRGSSNKHLDPNSDTGKAPATLFLSILISHDAPLQPKGVKALPSASLSHQFKKDSIHALIRLVCKNYKINVNPHRLQKNSTKKSLYVLKV